MNHQKYLSYSMRDFAEDDVFIDWVLNEDEEIDRFWEEFVDKYPQKKQELESARQLILHTRSAFATSVMTQEEKQAMNQSILSQIHQKADLSTKRGQVFSLVYRWAAAVVLVFSIAAALYFSQQRNVIIRHATAYGELQSFSLPDGSKVKLHANSSLEFKETWIEGKDREVWLKGEAFFEVEKKPVTRTKFLVHTQDLKVEVLGTEFNVDTRKNQTEVVLNEGSVKLELQDKERKTILMEPGDLVTFSQEKNKLNTAKVNSRIRISWKEGIQQFEKTPLEEVIVKLEEIYGIKFEVQDSALYDKNLTIGVPVENLEIAMATLENILRKSIVPTTENHFRIK